MIKHPDCDNICDRNGAVMTNIAEHCERKIIPSNDGGYIVKETNYTTFKQLQCGRCLSLIKKDKENENN